MKNWKSMPYIYLYFSMLVDIMQLKNHPVKIKLWILYNIYLIITNENCKNVMKIAHNDIYFSVLVHYNFHKFGQKQL